MQVGNIQQNQPNFKGSIYNSFIIDKSRANALKTIYNDVNKMIKYKPYDLYIEEDYGFKALSFSLKNSKPQNKLFSLDLEMKSVVDDSDKLPALESSEIKKLALTYKRTVKDLMGSYEKTQDFIDNILFPQKKIKNWLQKLSKKFGKNSSDNKEV